MIELKNVSKKYRHKSETIEVLKDFDLTIVKGEAVCIYGQSGSGKSTLLHIIGGMLMPTAGTVEINGTELTMLPLHFLSAFRRENIGFIFQQFNLLNKYTVLENVLFPLIPTGKNLLHEKDKALSLLARLGIENRVDFPVNHLSGGEQQRVAVARALVLEPAVIIADEPFSNLDPQNSEIILGIFEELKLNSTTFILSSTSSISGSEKEFVDRQMACSC